MYSKFKDSGFEILSFVCNEFSKEESEDEVEIEKWSTFPIFANIKVNGFGSSLLWKYL